MQKEHFHPSVGTPCHPNKIAFQIFWGTMCKMVTAGKDVARSCLSLIRLKRVFLVDTLEERIDALLDVLLSREVFNRDDRDDVLCQSGPWRE